VLRNFGMASAETLREETQMTKTLLVLTMTVATTLTGLMIWKAEATPLTGATGSLAMIKSYSAIQRVGCMFGTHRCPAGTKWACVKHPGSTGKSCVCRPC
jgi:hypothetical protein